MVPESALLTFDETGNQLTPAHPGAKELRHGLSVVKQIGDTLWVANDETITLERLRRQPGPAPAWADHRRFHLHPLLALPAPPDAAPGDAPEIDIEGLAYDAAGRNLWLVGSHSLKRKKADLGKKDAKNSTRLATVSADGNRYLLARLPLEPDADGLPAPVRLAPDGRHAARLRGDTTGNELTRELATDPHLGPFLAIPGKDNGFDIEGLALTPGGRLLLGLRGPVLRGWAVVLEVALEPDAADPATLRLRPIGPEGRLYRKHFVQLRGLGIRDLYAVGDDLLLLAGPTMDLDAPVTVFRWQGGAAPAPAPADTFTFTTSGRLRPVLEVPVGHNAHLGTDRAEGICRLTDPPGALLVVYDAADPARFREAAGVLADVFAVPEA